VNGKLAAAFASMEDDAIEPLIRNLNNPTAAARRETAWILGQLGPKAAQAVPALERALQDQDSYVRSNAADALKQIKQPAKKD
jgi:HEAT repeat protein